MNMVRFFAFAFVVAFASPAFATLSGLGDAPLQAVAEGIAEGEGASDDKGDKGKPKGEEAKKGEKKGDEKKDDGEISDEEKKLLKSLGYVE